MICGPQAFYSGSINPNGFSPAGHVGNVADDGQAEDGADGDLAPSLRHLKFTEKLLSQLIKSTFHVNMYDYEFIVHIYICVCMYMYVCMHVCMHVCIHIFAAVSLRFELAFMVSNALKPIY